MKYPSLTYFLFLVITIQSCNGQTGNAHKNKETNIEWPNYGNDLGGSRYSTSKEINEHNVRELKVSWTYQTGELKTYTGSNASSKAAFETTPIMIGGILYFSTPSCRVIAIDAATGKEKWVYDPKINLRDDFSEITSRGVSSWPAPNENATNQKERRIFIATIDGRLIALEASSGKTISTFGNNGMVNLRAGIGNDLSVTSPPAVVGNMVIVGSSMGDNQRFDYPRGTVRAYDAISGKLKWSWDPIPIDSTDKAWKTWNGPKAHQSGAANAWAVISADPKRDLVFIPTSCPSPDYYGGERLGQNLYGNSIVALKASTGKLVWYFQVVHHDLWDYDIAAQPMLIEIKRNKKNIPAVVVGTKMGHIFILNRETGEPIFPIEERSVPASLIKGEEANPTQPFPILPLPLGLQAVTTNDAWGLTENDKAEAKNRIEKYINQGIFTPPSHDGSIITPGNLGGIHWGGMCFDPNQGLLLTNINNMPALIKLLPRENAEKGNDGRAFSTVETGLQKGTPYTMERDYLFKIDLSKGGFVPQSSPPWGTILAIDINTGSKKWEIPLGYMLDPKKFPDAKKWGSINLGGAIATAGNLTFVAASRDSYLRAFNTSTGELLWESLLPAGGQATPMTYSVNNKQYVVIAAGGHGKFKTQPGDYVIAFALN